MILVELCAGTAAVSLWALGRCSPLTGYMGGKRRWAAPLVEALGVDQPDRVVLADAGPWGDAWSVLRTAAGRSGVLLHLGDLDACYELAGPRECWDRALLPPSDDATERIARWLVLQANQVRQLAVWWDGERWRDARGHRPAMAAPSNPGWRALLSPRVIGERLRDLDRIDWSRVDVVHGDARAVGPIGEAVLYLDPPYAGTTPYGPHDLARADVLAIAGRWSDAGCRVAVSEAEALPLDGWTARRVQADATRAGGAGLARRAEWVTANWPIVVHEQLGLWSAA